MDAADFFSDTSIDAALAEGAIKLIELIVSTVRGAGSDSAAVAASLAEAHALLAGARADATAARAEGAAKLAKGDEEPK